MKCSPLLLSIFFAAFSAHAQTAQTLHTTSSDTISESLKREARAALDRGLNWMQDAQQAEGHWSNKEFPALTGLAVWSLAAAGRADSEAVRKGVGFIMDSVHEDGSIWREPSEERKGGGLSSYNTAICMVALHAVNDPALHPTIANARRFIAGSQHLGDDAYQGGMGYDAETKRAYADLSNSYISYEAMRLTQNLKDLEGKNDAADLDWEAAEKFVTSLVNHDGGFIYKPGQSMAGAETNETGEVRFRSYGSMTYAGLLSLIYAHVDKEDPRIQSAFEWSVNHWTLDENPGMGSEGLYYFYNVLTKSLSAYGQDTFETESGVRINWREAIIQKLISLQQTDDAGNGYWQNPEGRWWEQDKVLVSAYSLIALQLALGE